LGTASGPDDDDDGIDDAAESALGERFAPVVSHDRDDANLPTSVDEFLRAASLEFYRNNGPAP
jgi:hypothetical protein